MNQTNENISKKSQHMMNRYIATMILAAVGDQMGYKGGSWQFNFDGQIIHQEMMAITNQEGIKKLNINRDVFPYSDDTVMHIATAKGLLQSQINASLQNICTNIAKYYKECMKFMKGRAPGMTCIRSTNRLNKDGSNWKDIHFQKNGGGCGASMRAACIGLYFYNNMTRLIEVSIQTGRTTHHNPLGYLGSLVAALFTAFSIKNIQPKQWLSLLLREYLPKAKEYVGLNRESELNIGSDWNLFETKWKEYAQYRNMQINSPNQPTFPKEYGVREREAAYKQFSINGWPGALGLDSVIVAYDALLSSLDYRRRAQMKGYRVNLWQEVCLRGMLHGGDSDSTGTIVGAWYGALYGFEDVYKTNYQDSEQKERICDLGKQIYNKVYDVKEMVSQNISKNTFLAKFGQQPTLWK